jgi:hypothetical protein
MPIIDFNPESLISGYQAQINSFNKKQKSSLSFHDSFENTTATTSLETAQSNISAILNELKGTIAGATIKEPNKQTVFQGLSTLPLTDQQWEDFEYSRDVPKLLNAGESHLANTLWGLRHALCYQLLIYTYYKSQENYTEDDLNLFKLGIFGSLTPTSDIDIGIQYSKKTQRTVGIIAHVIRTFEDAFISLTQKYSLAYDIEPYASIEFLDDDKGGLFYCDSTDFVETDLMQIMPAIGASIIRNVVQYSIDVHPDAYHDIRRYKLQHQQSGGTVDSITRLINTFTFDDIEKYFKSTVEYNKTTSQPNSGATEDGNTPPPHLSDIAEDQLGANVDYISSILTNPEWLPDAKLLAIDYMTTPYNVSRDLYYSKVKLAEEMLAKDTFSFDRNTIIAKSVRVALMKQNAESLVFRAESYVSPSTVMHIVRGIQAGEKLDTSCENLTVKKSKTHCVLGTYGYMMSCMEQIGYLYRFNKTYCEENFHKDQVKCTAKFNKYFPRLVDGLFMLSRISSSKQIGGKRRNYSKKLHKLKTQKRKNISKLTKRNSKQLRRRTNKRIRTHI